MSDREAQLEDENMLLKEQKARLEAENMDMRARVQAVSEQSQQSKMEVQMLRMELERGMREIREYADKNVRAKMMQMKLQEENHMLRKQLEDYQRALADAVHSQNSVSKEIECKNREGFSFKLSWSGPLDDHGLPKGQGTSKCSDGRTYEGSWTSGKTAKGHYAPYFSNGRAKITYADGGVFNGTVRSTADEKKLFRRGEGKLITNTGLTVDGCWNDQEQIEEI